MTIQVVLVDDHAVVRDGLRLLLETQPDIIVVGDATTGRDAVRQARMLQPHVLIMDIAMADMNGIEATRQIRELHPAPQVLVLSMHSTDEHIARAFQAGALGYVLKEAAGVEVVAAVRAVAAGCQYISQKLTEYQRSFGEKRHGASPLDRLSDREREVLQLIVEGRSSARIAEVLALSSKTVETYRSRLMHKLGISDLPTLVKFAISHGLTALD
jgi:DNA-binding NarL/FixJ family response regulator